MKRMKYCCDEMRRGCCSDQSDIAAFEDEEMTKKELLSEKEVLEKQLKEVNDALNKAK